MPEENLSVKMACLGCMEDFYADPVTLPSFCPECFKALSRHQRREIEKQVAAFRNEYKNRGGGTN